LKEERKPYFLPDEVVARAGLHVVGQHKGEAIAARPQADKVEYILPQLLHDAGHQPELEASEAILDRPVQQRLNVLGRMIDLAQHRPHPGGQKRPGHGVIEGLEAAQPVALLAEQAFVEHAGGDPGRCAVGRRIVGSQARRQHGRGGARGGVPDRRGHGLHRTPECSRRVGRK
jgi:hypothetical protein